MRAAAHVGSTGKKGNGELAHKLLAPITEWSAPAAASDGASDGEAKKPAPSPEKPAN